MKGVSKPIGVHLFYETDCNELSELIGVHSLFYETDYWTGLGPGFRSRECSVTFHGIPGMSEGFQANNERYSVGS